MNNRGRTISMPNMSSRHEVVNLKAIYCISKTSLQDYIQVFILLNITITYTLIHKSTFNYNKICTILIIANNLLHFFTHFSIAPIVRPYIFKGLHVCCCKAISCKKALVNLI